MWTIEGVTDILNRLDEKPKAVLLFTVCLHHFLGSDLTASTENWKKDFRRSFYAMLYGSLMQKTGPHSDAKLRRAMYDAVPERKG